MDQQRIQDRLNFIFQVLKATHDSKGNSQLIYPLLAANQDKLDYNFIHALRTWAAARLPELEASQAEGIARVIGQFSNLIKEFPLGNKAANMEISIVGYEISLTVFTRHSDQENWAMTQNNLGNAYLYRIRHNRAENIEKAIEAYQLALSVRTKNDFPILWATSTSPKATGNPPSKPTKPHSKQSNSCAKVPSPKDAAKK